MTAEICWLTIEISFIDFISDLKCLNSFFHVCGVSINLEQRLNKWEAMCTKNEHNNMPHKCQTCTFSSNCCHVKHSRDCYAILWSDIFASQFKILSSSPKITVFVFEHYFTSLRLLESCVGDGNSQLLTYSLIEWEFISGDVSWIFMLLTDTGTVRFLNKKFKSAVQVYSLLP